MNELQRLPDPYVHIIEEAHTIHLKRAKKNDDETLFDDRLK